MKRPAPARTLGILPPVALLAAIAAIAPSVAAAGWLWPWSNERAKPDTGAAARKVAEFNENFLVGGLAFDAGAKRLATSAVLLSNEVHVWDWRNQSIIKILESEGVPGEGRAISFSPDGKYLAVGHEGSYRADRSVRVWDAHTWQVVKDLGEPNENGLQMRIAFTPNARFFIRTVDRNADPGDYVEIYETEHWRRSWGLVAFPFRPSEIALTPDGKRVAVACAAAEGSLDHLLGHNKILIADLDQQRIVGSIDPSLPSGSTALSVAWRPDGKFVAVGTNAPVRQEDVGGVAIGIFDASTYREVKAETATKYAWVSGLSYSSDGRFLVEANVDGELRIWDSEHEQLLQRIPLGTGSHTVISLSPDGRFMAVGDNKHVSVWEFN